MGMFIVAICINAGPSLFSPCDGGFLCDRESCSKAPGLWDALVGTTDKVCFQPPWKRI